MFVMSQRSRSFAAIFLALSALIAGAPGAAQGEDPTPAPGSAVITHPVPGQAIQGSVPVHGDTAVAGFHSYELEFAYPDDPTGTWFLIDEGERPIAAGEIAEWDTTAITDGDYTLRLVVRLQDGTQIIDSVPGLRVRNYTAIETDTPAPLDTPPPIATPESSVRPTDTGEPAPIVPAPTPVAPRFLDNRDVFINLIYGLLVVVIGFSLLGIYLILRRPPRR